MHKEGLLSYWPRITWRRYQQLLDTFGSLDRVFFASSSELHNMPWQREFVFDFLSWKQSLDTEAITKELQNLSISCISIHDDAYPAALTELYDPPLALFTKGIVPSTPMIAIVGSRNNSIYGARVCNAIVSVLVHAGATIVSGLARGIDSIAHRSCIERGGRTIAVLGSGIDTQSIAPISHVPLAETIIETGGALISEYPPYTPASVYSFPKRNRIIAGLCDAVIIIEAAKKSGTRTTAHIALDLGRDLYAVPNSIYEETAEGVNMLIQEGATPITNIYELPQLLGLQ